MDICVSNETLSQTTRCKKNMSCLKGSTDHLCPVEQCVRGKVHFVTCLNKEGCSYRIPFADGQVCHCPVRKEIYNKYHV
jgi:hypothetical protein